MKYAKDLVIIIIFLLILTFLISLLSCNPVKKVLRDPEKFDIVVTEVIKRGYCVNDTTFITKSDTIVSFDTITNTLKQTIIKNDTAYIYETKYRTVIKTLKIRDTVKSIVLDNARIKLLQADSASLSQKVIKYKEQAKNRLEWLVLLILGLGLWLFFKYKP